MVMRNLNVGALGAVYAPETWNAALLAGGRELQNFLGWLFFGDADAGGGVVGFDASASSLNVTVTRGGGLWYDADPSSHSDAPLPDAPLSNWAWIYSEESIIKAIGAHDATNPRWDLISATWKANADEVVNVGFRYSVPGDTKTQRGTQLTLSVTAGTAAGSPSKPSTPAGAIPLWYVYVPASSGALVLVDARTHLPGPKRRPGTSPMSSITGVGTDANMIEVVARKVLQGDTAWLSSLRWDATKDWPYIIRGLGGSNEVGTALYPLVAPADRKWSETYSLGNPDINVVDGTLGTDVECGFDGNTDPYGYLVDKATSADLSLFLYFQLPVQNRGLQITKVELSHRYEQAFDGTVDIDVELVKDLPTSIGTVLLAALDIDAAGAGARLQANVPISGTASQCVIGDGHRLFARVSILQTGAANANGKLRLYGLTLTFQEGRSA